MTSPLRNKQPEPWNLLYENLFVRRDRASALRVISEGLNCFAENASSLLNEAKILADAQKKARAVFLVATANEEIAKSYILLDACRLNFTSHEAPLKKICRAFYGHIEKYAYNKTIRGKISAQFFKMH
jgi:AbiV family abortive infection protein